MSWRRFLRLRPWFHLNSNDGEKISGQVLADNSLELEIDSGWSKQTLKLSKDEVEQLILWLSKTYRSRKGIEHGPKSSNVLSISRAKGNPGPGPGGAGA